MAGKYGVAQQRVGGCLSTQRACSKARESIPGHEFTGISRLMTILSVAKNALNKIPLAFAGDDKPNALLDPSQIN